MRKIRLHLVLLLPALLLSASNQASWAQGASVTGATMTWYGVYTAATNTQVNATKNIATGITPPAANSDRVSVPTKDKISFGYGYTLIGSPPTALVALTYRTIFPDGRYQDNIYDRLAINRQDLFIGQILPPDGQTGTYTLQLWHGGGMLLAKSFSVQPGTTVNSTAATNWGCRAGASDHSVTHTWGNTTEQEARAYTLKLCESVHNGCYITECAPNISTQAEADAKWPLGTKPVKCIGNAKC